MKGLDKVATKLESLLLGQKSEHTIPCRPQLYDCVEALLVRTGGEHITRFLPSLLDFEVNRATDTHCRK